MVNVTMPENNLDRMMQLVEEFFGTKDDPSQISVDEKVVRRLKKIHPATMSEKRTRKGPVAWTLVIPTTHQLMEQFISGKINERELLFKTPLRSKYDSLYLCSAFVLPEYRGSGWATRLMSRAINTIRKDHPLENLFYWALSSKGKKLARSLAREFSLPLSRRV